MNKQIIKWSGSKRSQSKRICDKIPNDTFDKYIEPFCGSASVLIELLNRDDKKKFNSFQCSDINNDLINLWNLIKNNPEKLLKGYEKHWIEFNKNDIQHRKDYFNIIKKKYNTEHDPIDFMFIMRTTTNGMPRYNNKGEFNNSCHFSRPGINSKSLNSIILNASELLNKNNVIFTCSSFEDYNTQNENNFFYLDPPYNATKGMYYGNFNSNIFFNWINNNSFKYILSYDGKIKNGDNYTIEIPIKYKNHEYLESGNSSFRRVIGNTKNSIILESIYMNF
jgi:DNA adenine methylase